MTSPTTWSTPRAAERVGKLTLIDSAGVGTHLPLMARLAVTPLVGEYLMRVVGTRQLMPSRRNVLYPERHSSLDSAYLETARFRGSRRAVLRSLRNMPLSDYEHGYAALGALGKPVLVVWGRRDKVVPFTVSERLRHLVRATAFLPVEDAGHFPHFEQPDVVNRALAEFFVDRGSAPLVTRR